MLSFIQFFTFERQVILFFFSLSLGLLAQFTWGFAWSWIPFLIVIVLGLKHFLLGTVNAAAMALHLNDWSRAKKLLRYTFKPSWLRFGNHGMYYLLASRIAFEEKDTDKAESLALHATSLDMLDDMKAMAYLQLIGIAAPRQQRSKIELYLKQIKKLKVNAPEIKEQIKQLDLMLSGQHPDQKKIIKQQQQQQQNFMTRRSKR